jgi:hypothetical protein
LSYRGFKENMSEVEKNPKRIAGHDHLAPPHCVTGMPQTTTPVIVFETHPEML